MKYKGGEKYQRKNLDYLVKIYSTKHSLWNESTMGINPEQGLAGLFAKKVQVPLI